MFWAGCGPGCLLLAAVFVGEQAERQCGCKVQNRSQICVESRPQRMIRIRIRVDVSVRTTLGRPFTHRLPMQPVPAVITVTRSMFAARYHPTLSILST